MKELKYKIINYGMLYAIWLGYTAIRIDFKVRHVKMYKLLNIFLFISGILFLSMVPNAVKVNLTHIRLNVRNPLIGYAFAITIIIRVMLLFGSFVMRIKRDKLMFKWYEKLLLIQVSYFDRFHHLPADMSYIKWLLFNMLIMLTHGISLFINLWEMYIHNKLYNFFDLFILCGVINLQHFVMWHHEVLLCYLHENFSKLNYQLEHQQFDPKLSLIYFQLTQLFAELNIIYSPVIIWLQLCLIVTNAIVGYISTLYFTSSIVENSTYDFLLGGKLYLLLCVHMFLYFMLGDRAVQTTRKTSFILKFSNIRENYSEIELISLNLLLSKVRVSIRGMFNINLSSLFSIIAQTVLLTIVLVQVEIQNQTFSHDI
ncbi:uncharacterized protein ACRADG_010756 [Cochliomyia hominivorax]